MSEEKTAIGHNGGPTLDEDDEPPGKLLFIGWAWRRARQAAFKAPTTEIALFRLARAEAAGLTYDAYVAALLDTGRYDQTGDLAKRSTPKSPLSTPYSHGTRGPAKRVLLQAPTQSPHDGQRVRPTGRTKT